MCLSLPTHTSWQLTFAEAIAIHQQGFALSCDGDTQTLEIKHDEQQEPHHDPALQTPPAA